MPEGLFEKNFIPDREELNFFDNEKEEKPPVLPVEKIPIGLLEYRPGTAAGRRIREYLIKRQEGKCAYCGREGQRLSVDHIVPRAKGGSGKIGNLAIVCVDCNSRKADNEIERQEQPVYFYPEKDKPEN